MNTIMMLDIRKEGSTWVFDDESKGIVREPFVCGINEMIDDAILAEFGRALTSVRVIFSGRPFPGVTRVWNWRGKHQGGNYYSDGEREGWLCPCMYRYFEDEPLAIYVKVEET